MFFSQSHCWASQQWHPALLRYTCLLDWFGEERDLEVVANDGWHPLLRVGLLLDHDLHISYRSGNITIN